MRGINSAVLPDAETEAASYDKTPRETAEFVTAIMERFENWKELDARLLELAERHAAGWLGKQQGSTEKGDILSRDELAEIAILRRLIIMRNKCGNNYYSGANLKFEYLKEYVKLFLAEVGNHDNWSTDTINALNKREFSKLSERNEIRNNGLYFAGTLRSTAVDPNGPESQKDKVDYNELLRNQAVGPTLNEIVQTQGYLGVTALMALSLYSGNIDSTLRQQVDVWLTPEKIGRHITLVNRIRSDLEKLDPT